MKKYLLNRNNTRGNLIETIAEYDNKEIAINNFYDDVCADEEFNSNDIVKYTLDEYEEDDEDMQLTDYIMKCSNNERDEDMLFIKKFQEITIKSICEKLGVDRSNLYATDRIRVSNAKVKRVKGEIENQIRQLNNLYDEMLRRYK